MQRRAPRLRRHHAQVHLQARASVRIEVFVSPLRDDLARLRAAPANASMIGPGRRPAATRMSMSPIVSRHPPQRARVRALRCTRGRPQSAVDELLGQRPWPRSPARGRRTAAAARCPRRMFSSVFGAEALQAREPAGVDGRGELLDRGDAQLLVQDHRLLRAEARDRHHLPHAGRDLRPELLERRGSCPVCRYSSTFSADRLADARDLRGSPSRRARRRRRGSRRPPGRPSRRREA